MRCYILVILFYLRYMNVGGEPDTLNEQVNKWKRSENKYKDFDGRKNEVEERSKEDVTVECLYQYPTSVHVNALQSNIMNVLTKIFVRTRSYLLRRSGRRKSPLRFHIVNTPNASIFDHIFTNMTHDFSDYATNLSHPVSRSTDPCTQQDELKLLWTQLLDYSHKVLLEATEQFLDRLDQDKMKKKLKVFQEKQLQKARKSQLRMLCEVFQLCYYDI